MSVDKRVRIGRLIDYYGELLTVAQRDAVKLYYDCDLSLSEIADDTDISRQAVQDMVKKATSKLEKYERALKMCARLDAIDKSLTALSAQAQKLTSDAIAEKLNKIIEGIREA